MWLPRSKKKKCSDSRYAANSDDWPNWQKRRQQLKSRKKRHSDSCHVASNVELQSRQKRNKSDSKKLIEQRERKRPVASVTRRDGCAMKRRRMPGAWKRKEQSKLYVTKKRHREQDGHVAQKRRGKGWKQRNLDAGKLKLLATPHAVQLKRTQPVPHPSLSRNHDVA
jgi:hypothetical protein